MGRTGRPSPPLGRVIPNFRERFLRGGFFIWRGRFICPLRPFFTRTCVCFPPQVFFFFFGPRVPEWSARRYWLPCRLLSAAPRTPRNSLNATPKDTPANFGRIRGKNAVRFFFGPVFREIPLIVFVFFTLLLLGFQNFLGIYGIFGEFPGHFGNSKSLLDQCKDFPRNL